MNYAIAGLELDLGHTAWLFDPEAAVPIFHAAGLRYRGDGTEARILVTRCGLPVHAEDRNGYRTAAHLPPRHAVRFARPCRRCWPALLQRPGLFDRPTRSRRDTPDLRLV